MNIYGDKDYWKDAILDFMYKKYPIGGSKHIGVEFIFSFASKEHSGKERLKTGLHRLLSIKGIKGMTEDQLQNKIKKLTPVLLNLLVDEGKIKFIDTHTYLRYIYYIPTKARGDVNAWIIAELTNQKKNKLIVRLIQYFNKNDLASYDDLRNFLNCEGKSKEEKKKNRVNFTHDRLKGTLTILENLGLTKKHDYTSEDRFLIIYSKPHIAESTVKLKADKIREIKNLKMRLGAEEGRNFEKKIEEIIKKQGKEVRKVCYDHVSPIPLREEAE